MTIATPSRHGSSVHWGKRQQSTSNDGNGRCNGNTTAITLDGATATQRRCNHNPECFRIYKAVEAGSIPILTRDDMHRHGNPNEKNSMALCHVPHSCANALLHWYWALIIVLDLWDDLYPTVERLLEDPAGLDNLQHRLCHLYDEYMCMIVAKFEDIFLG